MIAKRIDLGSIPYGLDVAAEDVNKGMLVVKGTDGFARPTTQAEADAVYGFANLVIDTKEGGDYVDHNVIPEGKKLIVHTLVKNNRWGTTEFTGTLAVGDKLVVGYDVGEEGEAGDAGILRKPTADEITASRAPQFKVAKAAYKIGSMSMIDVDVL